MELRHANHCVYKIRYHMVFCMKYRKNLLNKEILNFSKTYALRLVKDTVLNLMQLVAMVIMYIFLLDLNQNMLLLE